MGNKPSILNQTHQPLSSDFSSLDYFFRLVGEWSSLQQTAQEIEGEIGLV
jgi:hypothetical protein